VTPLAFDVTSFGWVLGLAVALAGIVLGQAILRTLVRLKVPWWGSVAAPLLVFGPAIGLLVGTWVHAGDASAVALGGEATWLGARIGWSLLVFFAADAAFDLVRAFLSSRVVQEEFGLRIPSLLFDLTRLILWILLVFAIISRIWHAEKAVAAALGLGAALSLAVALAMQETLKNVIAGLAIVTEGMYRIGDWVWIGDEEGEVVGISRRTTKIRTRRADIVTFPNSLVTMGKVRNESRPTPVHAELLLVNAAYDAPPNRVRDVMRRALLEVPKVLQNPPPLFRLVRFAESGVEYEVKLFLTDLAALNDIRSDAMIQIWYHFHREGIEIPYPVREVRRRPRGAGTDDRAKVVLACLRAVPFFQALPDDLLGVLARDARLVEFGASERVVLQGEAADACYVVESGRLAVFVSDGARERQVATLGAGDLFGEMGLLTGEPRSATVRALDDARLVAVGSSALGAALERSPELAHALAEVAMLRKEGLLEARASLDAAARARVDAGTKRLREVIKRFFRLPNPEAEGGTDRVAGNARPA
jgi:small-conductance mechanosensitive channel/CRP-like cAMP-binding protein